MPTSGIAVINKRLGDPFPPAMDHLDHEVLGTYVLELGSFFTGVIDFSCHPDDMSTCGARFPHGTPILVFQRLPLGRVTIYDAKITAMDDLLYLVVQDNTWWCASDPQPKCLEPTVLELCAGCGGMGVGAIFMGATVKVAVDHNAFATAHLEANQHGQVMTLDLLDPATAKQVHQAFNAQPGTTTMGFPCQPFSTQGQQLGSSDERFLVFYAGLRIAFLMQSQTLILECVPAAGQCLAVQQSLALIAQLLGMVCHQVELDLKDQWPCSRRRWWALLMPQAWHSMNQTEHFNVLVLFSNIGGHGLILMKLISN